MSKVRPERDPSCDSYCWGGISFMTRHNLMHFKELAVASLRPRGEGGREAGKQVRRERDIKLWSTLTEQSVFQRRDCLTAAD